jgi:UDP-N-acetylmuramoyl-L-alanyl-D-glutamate--2,6-diaminopimelate ligase
MTWSQLHSTLRVHGLTPAEGPEPVPDRPVTGIAYDSRVVRAGEVFVALKGQRADGTAFARQAIDRGAAAIVAEHPSLDVRVPWATVSDARLALAILADAFFQHPSGDMQVVGITGTNGKTTTAYLIASIFEAAGIRCGILGTVAYRVGPGDQDVREAERTTPEAPDVQALLRDMVDRGCRACVMEVSSHALALRRVDGMSFAAAVFTNLTRDHLDFHTDMESYFQAKRRLFEMIPSSAPSLLNIDDPRGSSLAGAGGRALTYAVSRPADFVPGPLSSSLQGLSFDVRTPSGVVHMASRLVGRPNVYNILAAVSTTTALGLPLDAVERGIRDLHGVPGRFQVVSGTKDEVTVVVDYAHTDDALRNLLETARPLTVGQLITVFGCGGDRDRTKRPLMGAVANRFSDVIVITSDNPRSEDPKRIIEEIQRGITADTRRDSTQRQLAIVDRREAIAKAVEIARAGDLVLIAGKGHEKYQVIGDRTLPFDDVAVAQEALGRRQMKSGVT